MKIICESCGAKYSIADEKVAGKVFKIRCKKCSEVIVVRGDQPEETEEETRVFDYGSDAAWHVVVDGEQQGPLAPTQIGDMLAEGRIDWEAFVWREGFDNWQPAKDVQELVAAVMAESEPSGAHQPAQDPGAVTAQGKTATAEAEDPYGSGQVFGSGDMGEDPFAGGDDDGGLGGVVNQPTASASAAGGSADLFAGVAGGDDFSGGDAPDQPPAAAAAEVSPRVSAADAMTGTRNENSVLFSLSNLQALATSSGSSPPSAAAPAERPGMAQGEGSGLIDIRALASANQSMKGGESADSGDNVESLLAVGGGGSTFSAAAIAAPVAAEKSEGTNKLVLGLVAALGVLVLALGGVVVAILMKDEGAPATAAAAAPGTPPAATAAAAAVPSAGAAEAAKPATDAEEGEEPGEDEKAVQAEEPKERSAAAGDNDDDRSERERERKRRQRERSSGGSDSPARSAANSKPAPEPKAAPKRGGGDGDIDSLLSAALGGKGGGKARPKRSRSSSGSANLPDAPDRNAVKNALQSVAGRVKACGKGESGVAMTKITVRGTTGRVTNAVVSGSFAGTPVGSCVARTVRSARFPKFKQSTFTVSYPYRL